MSTLHGRENSIKKRIVVAKDELHEFMSKIDSETKKQVICLRMKKVLRDLVELLDKEMCRFQAEQKQEEESNIRREQQNKAKKMEYDIDQILQKQNE